MSDSEVETKPLILVEIENEKPQEHTVLLEVDAEKAALLEAALLLEPLKDEDKRDVKEPQASPPAPAPAELAIWDGMKRLSTLRSLLSLSMFFIGAMIGWGVDPFEFMIPKGVSRWITIVLFITAVKHTTHLVVIRQEERAFLKKPGGSQPEDVECDNILITRKNVASAVRLIVYLNDLRKFSMYHASWFILSTGLTTLFVKYTIKHGFNIDGLTSAESKFICGKAIVGLALMWFELFCINCISYTARKLLKQGKAVHLVIGNSSPEIYKLLQTPSPSPVPIQLV